MVMLEANLKSLQLEAAGRELGTIAANWYRISVDRLPVRGKTLEDVRQDYLGVFDSLPLDATPEELETILINSALAMKLREGNHVIKTQIIFSRRGNPKEEIEDVDKLMADDYTSIALDRLIILHSRWIARKLAESASANNPDAEETIEDYSRFEEYETEGSWLDDFNKEESPQA